MKHFELSQDMLNLRGQFYPTGHIVAMFATADAAEAAGSALQSAGLDADDISLITPEAMLRDIVRTVGSSGATLPSAGTEADTVRRYADYASSGHYGLLVKAPDHDDSDRVMEVLQRHQVAHAQKYRMLVIEDLA
ncbi:MULTISPECIES: RNA-binding protein [Ramlibacter]|uniref:RNA-binding protein n=1 Tax=Ramlibacter pinisoli TaxID=2682844 RepID=A0A6N8IN50_9BURK|nr:MULTISPECIES: RNA-binding protein [Ramlibacter]MBA2963281.1 RNA-binding protein [Ramlibacter sp. CGMCC 1.13660]MVQ28248.1 RNA-binding protein [Ramlibacter pinisoli]